MPRNIDRGELAEWNFYDAVSWAGPATLDLLLPWEERMTIALPPGDGSITTPPYTPD